MASREAEVALESGLVVTSNAQRGEGAVPPLDASAQSLNEEASKGSWFQRNKWQIFGIASKLAAITSLMLTALTAWPTVSSAGDTRTATLLAEWTAQKEFLEFCEAHDWLVDQCPEYKDVVLRPPPIKPPTLFRRIYEFRPSILIPMLEGPVHLPATDKYPSSIDTYDVLRLMVGVGFVVYICTICIFNLSDRLREAAAAALMRPRLIRGYDGLLTTDNRGARLEMAQWPWERRRVKNDEWLPTSMRRRSVVRRSRNPQDASFYVPF
ncbi:hypothetical protein GE09DRAFT_154250 [Coniochaeta sp. 2T2.1]|nr:hypothetical protein GE09DRAFT_154250 [Coniochaeta sp. 2T2.1]